MPPGGHRGQQSLRAGCSPLGWKETGSPAWCRHRHRSHRRYQSYSGETRHRDWSPILAPPPALLPVSRHSYKQYSIDASKKVAQGHGNRGVRRVKWPPPIYPGVKHGISTPRFFGKKYFLVYSQLILSKIIKTVATSCQILRLKCTKFVFSCSSAPDPAGGA